MGQKAKPRNKLNPAKQKAKKRPGNNSNNNSANKSVEDRAGPSNNDSVQASSVDKTPKKTPEKKQTQKNTEAQISVKNKKKKKNADDTPKEPPQEPPEEAPQEPPEDPPQEDAMGPIDDILETNIDRKTLESTFENIEFHRDMLAVAQEMFHDRRKRRGPVIPTELEPEEHAAYISRKMEEVQISVRNCEAMAAWRQYELRRINHPSLGNEEATKEPVETIL